MPQSVRALLTGIAAFAVAAILSAAMTGCGQAQSASDEHTATVSIDPAFAAYVSRFEAASAEQGAAVKASDIIVKFGQVEADPSEPTGTRGVCEKATGQTPVVTISADAWAASSEAEREELVFHELGHCLLGLTHVAGINQDGIPKSIMNPVKISGAIYSQNRTYYVASLFAAKK